MTYNLPYKENISWTPVITGVSSAGTATYSVQAGYYTRVGNLVSLSASLTWTGHTGTGDMTITGIPLACRNVSNYKPQAAINTISIALPASTIAVVGSLAANASTITLQAIKDNTTNAPVQMSAAGTIYINLTYLT